VLEPKSFRRLRDIFREEKTKKAKTERPFLFKLLSNSEWMCYRIKTPSWRAALLFPTLKQHIHRNPWGPENITTLRPKLKLGLFALYRPTRKNPADSKDFIGKKSIVFLLVTTVHHITFIVYLPRQLQKRCKKLGNQCYS